MNIAKLCPNDELTKKVLLNVQILEKILPAGQQRQQEEKLILIRSVIII